MSTRWILLWLEAPLQSWGVDSKFGRRDSLSFPTRSGVLGLILCALGASGEQKELLETMSGLKQTVVSFSRTKESSSGTAHKAEREPLLRDFHMVGSGYDDGDPWQSMLIPKTSEGKKAVGGGTKLTYRYYLQDARFAVALEVPNALTQRITEALRLPMYDLYLGRKNCVPTDTVYRGTFDHEETALEEAEVIAQGKGLLVEDFRVVDGEMSDRGYVMSLNDIPLQFGEIKRYRERRVTVIWHE